MPTGIYKRKLSKFNKAECNRQWYKKAYKERPEHFKKKRIRNKYGLSYEEIAKVVWGSLR